MTINTKNTVRELALSVPGATLIFEKMGIDYCCGGNQSLATACHKAQVPVEKAVEALEHSEQSATPNGNARDWQTETLSALIEHIVNTHHAFTRNELARIEVLIEKVCSAHGANHPELSELRNLTKALTQDLIPHMLKEEQVLFPYIDSMEVAAFYQQPAPQPFFMTVKNPVRMMMTEHDNAGDVLRAIRTVTREFTLPDDACATFQALYESL